MARYVSFSFLRLHGAPAINVYTLEREGYTIIRGTFTYNYDNLEVITNYNFIFITNYNIFEHFT